MFGFGCVCNVCLIFGLEIHVDSNECANDSVLRTTDDFLDGVFKFFERLIEHSNNLKSVGKNKYKNKNKNENENKSCSNKSNCNRNRNNDIVGGNVGLRYLKIVAAGNNDLTSLKSSLYYMTFMRGIKNFVKNSKLSDTKMAGIITKLITETGINCLIIQPCPLDVKELEFLQFWFGESFGRYEYDADYGRLSLTRFDK